MDLGAAHLDIDPVSIDAIRTARGGKRVQVTDDAASVVRHLQEIDGRFRVHYSIDAAVFVLEVHEPQEDGSTVEHFVGAYPELDARIVKRAQEFTQPGFDLAGEIERAERLADQARDHARREQVGDAAERLGHALRQDLGRHEATRTKNSIAVIPRAFRPE